jgi:DNA-binding beta-propeller fold protein YncE
VLPAGELAVVDRDAGVAGIFAGDGRFISYLEAPRAFHPSLLASGTGLGLYLLDALSSEIYRYDSRWNLSGLAYSAVGTALYTGMAFDKSGRVYLSDQESDEVLVIDPALGTERRMGGFGAERGMFVDPAGIAIDERGLLHICDWGNSRLQILDEWGGVVKVWKLMSEGCVARPRAIAVDRWGNSFVMDDGCECLRVLSADGVETVRLEGKGPGLGFLSRPEGLDIDSERLIVADAVDGEVQIFDIQYATYR